MDTTMIQWPCEFAALWQHVRCPQCSGVVQIRQVCSNPLKHNYGRYYVIHPKENGGCGYFSYVLFARGESSIYLQNSKNKKTTTNSDKQENKEKIAKLEKDVLELQKQIASQLKSSVTKKRVTRFFLREKDSNVYHTCFHGTMKKENANLETCEMVNGMSLFACNDCISFDLNSSQFTLEDGLNMIHK